MTRTPEDCDDVCPTMTTQAYLCAKEASHTVFVCCWYVRWYLSAGHAFTIHLTLCENMEHKVRVEYKAVSSQFNSVGLSVCS